MPKIEINFPGDFESGRAGALPVGRIMLGGYVLRLVFTPRGEVVGLIDKGAIASGNLILMKSPEEGGLFGFGQAPGSGEAG